MEKEFFITVSDKRLKFDNRKVFINKFVSKIFCNKNFYI